MLKNDSPPAHEHGSDPLKPSVAHLVKRDLGAGEVGVATAEAATATTTSTVTTTASATKATATTTVTEATTAATTTATATSTTATEATTLTGWGAGTSVIKTHVAGIATTNGSTVLGLQRSLGLLNGIEGDIAVALQVTRVADNMLVKSHQV